MTTKEMHKACRLFEQSGEAAFEEAERRFGREVAKLLLICHLRREQGSMGRFPHQDIISQKVMARLQELGIK